MLRVIMLNVVMLSVVMLSVVASCKADLTELGYPVGQAPRLTLKNYTRLERLSRDNLSSLLIS